MHNYYTITSEVYLTNKNILAVDSCSDKLTVVLTNSCKIFTCKVTNLKHSVSLQPAINKLMEIAKCNISDIDIFAATYGPGSYTGIRIGLSTINTLAHFQNKPIVGISSLDLLLWQQTITSEYALTCIDAGGKRLFASLWLKRSNGWQRICEDTQFVDKQLPEFIARHLSSSDTLSLIGNGQIIAEDLLCGVCSTLLISDMDIQPKSLILLTEHLATESTNYTPLKANYCTTTQAERLHRKNIIKQITIHGMLPIDLNSVAEIDQSSFAKPWGKTAYARELEKKDSQWLVAKHHGVVCGFIGWQTVAKDVEILNFAVSPKYRDLKIGKLLFEAALKRIAKQGVDNIFLEVRASNQAAIKIYEQAGFLLNGTRKKYYKDNNEDALLYQKVIQNQ